MLSVAFFIVMLDVIMLKVSMLTVVMLNVEAPLQFVYCNNLAGL
jgi:hypothetical protein